VATRALPASLQSPTRRLELPGTVAETAENGAGRRAAFMDQSSQGIEAPPSPSAPATNRLGESTSDKPRFNSGPLSPATAAGMPLGATPFDANLLHVRLPTAAPEDAAFPSNGAVAPSSLNGSARPAKAENGAAPTNGKTVPGTFDFMPALDYGDLASGAMPAHDTLGDFDATRLVGDFDLPDAGFETHVFSTAELIGDIQLDALSYPSVVSHVPEVPPVTFSSAPIADAPPEEPPAALPATPPAALPVATPPVALPAALQAPLDELAALVDVAFARLIGADGASLRQAGQQTVDPAVDAAIAAVLNTAIMEGQQLELGACNSLTVEAPAAALLLSPLPGGMCLAVQLTNPTRLGLLRRQVRKPLAALRALLVEAGVS
jgi:predicted regulator of Ras-like GTPase activity (Roadblock/LC7/MglB family)